MNRPHLTRLLRMLNDTPPPANPWTATPDQQTEFIDF